MLEYLFSNEPSWISTTILGAVFGALLPLICKVFVYLFRLFRKHPLLGIWNSYFYSFEDDVVVFKTDKWIIKKGILHKFIIKTGDLSNRFGKYKGYFFHDNTDLNILLKGIYHRESIFLKIPFIIPKEQSKYIGISNALDYDGKVKSSAFILSKDSMSEAEIVSLMNQHVNADIDRKILRIK